MKYFLFVHSLYNRTSIIRSLISQSKNIQFLYKASTNPPKYISQITKNIYPKIDLYHLQMNNDENSLANYKIDWSLWEIYRVGAVIKDYESSIKKLIKIKSFQDFYELALYVPHLSPSKLFYEKESRSKSR